MVLLIYSIDMEQALESSQLTQVHTLMKTDFPFFGIKQLSIVSVSWDSWTSSLFCAGMLTVQGNMAAVNLWVQQFCYTLKILFHSILSPTSGSDCFSACLLFYDGSWSLGRGLWYRCPIHAWALIIYLMLHFDLLLISFFSNCCVLYVHTQRQTHKQTKRTNRHTKKKTLSLMRSVWKLH